MSVPDSQPRKIESIKLVIAPFCLDAERGFYKKFNKEE
jgi:hypothetical protein